MCDNCECEIEWNNDGTAFVAKCKLRECVLAGTEKEGDCKNEYGNKEMVVYELNECKHLCDCGCHTDHTPDGMTLAKGD